MESKRKHRRRDSDEQSESNHDPRNNTSFPMQTYEHLKSLKWDPRSERALYHQYVTVEYLRHNPKQRGILAYHGLGAGKTELARLCVTRLGRTDMRVIIISPKSVHGQFQNTFRSYKGRIDYFSTRASNLVAQIERLGDAPGVRGDADAPGVRSDDGLASVRGTGSFDDSFVIVDEAYEFFNSVANGSANAVDIYDMMMAARGARIIFLAATPIVNDPFELVPCYNILAGYKLFPESREDFYALFIKDGRMINRDKFINRIYGLTSYFGELAQPQSILDRFPKLMPPVVMKIPMSHKQFGVYSVFREKEREETKRPGFRSKSERFGSKSSAGTYRINSRKASNLVPVNNAKDSDLLDPESCPKFHVVVDKILPDEIREGETGIILSNLVHDCGLGDLARLMTLKGWERWEAGVPADPKSRRFAIVSGDETLAERDEIRRTFSEPDNARGNIIRVLLIGPAAFSGLNLKNGRYAVILDRAYNNMREEQGVGRVRRLDGQPQWPENNRVVKVYKLLADYPTDIDEKTREYEDTTEIDIDKRANTNRKLHHEFFLCQIESSMDCGVHRDQLPPDRAAALKCKMCSPTDVPLWDSRIETDIKAPDTCHPPQVHELKAKEIVIEDADVGKDARSGVHKGVHSGVHKYMYTEDDGEYSFYEFSKKLNGYVKIPRNHRHFDVLLATARKDS